MIQVIYHYSRQGKLVIWLNLRTNQFQESDFCSKVQTRQETTLLMQLPEPKPVCNRWKCKLHLMQRKYSLASSMPASGNLSEPWRNCFLAECSDKGLSSQYLRPNIQPNYQKRDLALRQYQSCCRDLNEQLGVKPGPSLQKLYQRLANPPG